ncbi:zincin, partial [Auricularia subglabra TFB-10046 SS5]
GAGSVSTQADAVVTATVTNTGDEAVKVLNHPSTVLSKGPTDMFVISSSEGKAPRFQGIFGKYLPGADKSYTTIQPGQSVTVKHSLADAYDFTGSGAGTYNIKPSPVFYIVTDEGVKTLTADVAPHSATLSGALVKPGPRSLIVPVKNCGADDQKAIQAAAQAADGLVHESVKAILGTRNTTRYVTWFGTYSASRYARVLETYTNVIKTSFVFDVKYECLSDEQCEGLVDSDAFTTKNDAGKIWICPDFFYIPLNGSDSQGGVLVHLATHWLSVADAGHWALGQFESELLAENWPDLAVDNADNYEYYAENDSAL